MNVIFTFFFNSVVLNSEFKTLIYKIILAKIIKAGSVEIDMTEEKDETKKDVSAN